MSMETISSVTKRIALDFAQKTSPVTVFAKQGDENTRHIIIQPLMNGVPVSIDRDPHYEARFAAKKPDGKFVYNDSATLTDDGLISVVLTDQTLAAHGNALCCVILTDKDTQQTLTSQNFTLIIEYSAGAYKNLASSDEIMGLDDKLAQVQAMIDRLNREGQTMPPINPEDANKVLTANEDGTAEWKDPQGGDDVFTVKFELTGTVFTADKTTSEILAAYLEGKSMYATLTHDGFERTSSLFYAMVTDIENLIGRVQVCFVRSNELLELSVLNLSGAEKVTHLAYSNPFVKSTSKDNGKVLSVVNGFQAWVDPSELEGVGVAVTEVSSPEEIPDKDGLYIVPTGGSGTVTATIHVYDSLDQVPADLPEGSFVAVPSTGGGGGGLPVVELTTVIRESPDGSNPTFFSAEESQKLEAAFNGGMPPVMKFSILAEDDSEQSIITTASIMADMIVFSAVGFHFMFMPVEDNLWCGLIGRAE